MVAFDSKHIHFGRYLPALLLCFALIANAQVEPGEDDSTAGGRSALPGSMEQMETQAAALPSATVTWLGEGENRFLAQYRGAPPGTDNAVLIVGDSIAGDNSPHISHHLYRSLPQSGWSTLHITLPAPPAAIIPQRQFGPGGPTGTGQPPVEEEVEGEVENEVKDETQNEPAANDDNTDINTVSNRLSQSLGHLLNNGAKSVLLVCSGTQSARTLKALGGDLPEPLAVVTLNADLLALESSELQKLAEKKLRVFDISDRLPEQDLQSEKRRHMRLAGIGNYFQLSAPYFDSSAGQQYLERRIRKLLQDNSNG